MFGSGLYYSISGFAVVGYLFIFMIFMNAKKDRLINSFLTLTMSTIFWTGGSLLMRQQIWPSYIFWYHVSLGGLLLMVVSYFRFISAFAQRRNKIFEWVYTSILGLIFVINVPTGFFLHWPSVEVLNGQEVMVYDKITPWVFVIFAVALFIAIHVIFIIGNYTKNNPRAKKQMAPIIIGIIFLFATHFAFTLPIFSGFPIDIIGGVINLVLLVYVLVMQRMFRLQMIASKNVGYLFCIVMSFVAFYNSLSLINRFVDESTFVSDHQLIGFYLISYTVYALIFFLLWEGAVKRIFIKPQEIHESLIATYNAGVTSNLNMDSICIHTKDALMKGVQTEKVFICLYNSKTKEFEVRHSSHPLTDISMHFTYDHPLVQTLDRRNRILEFDDFTHTIAYKGIWTEEKQQLNQLSITHCLGISNSDKLIGFILFSNSDKKRDLKENELSFITSISTIASVALNNALRYEKAYFEARTDELTEVLNRRYFLEILDEVFEKNKNGSLAMVIINLDDFKLYNQLYGVQQGDAVLKEIAKLIEMCVGDHGYVSRYGGKEYAVVLPRYDVHCTKNLSQSIQRQIGKIGKNDTVVKKSLTCSIGICVYPYGAGSIKELIENTEHAVFQVKRKGKNGMKVFDTFVNGTEEGDNKINYASIYEEYKSTIYALTAAIDAKDHYTFSHSENVAKYAVALAERLNVNTEIIENIRQAALLHDVGKISISETILNKPFQLDDSEFEIMKGHVEASINIIRHLPSLDYVIPAVLGHHERWDGKGYPRRISGTDIPLTARILAIADAFDAIISKRCYKQAMPIEKALLILEEESGKQFDPELVPEFIEMIRDGELKMEMSNKGVLVVS